MACNPLTQICDAAWFYSSLAQASASIVGVVGAVFITRLVDHAAGVRLRWRGLQEQIEQLAADFRGRGERAIDQDFLRAQGLAEGDYAIIGRFTKMSRRFRGPMTQDDLRIAIAQTELIRDEFQSPWAKSYVGQVAQMLQDVRHRYNAVRDEVLPRPLVAVWVLLAGLTIVGILWPLAVLPGVPEAASSKWLIWIAFGLFALAFVVYLGFELLHLLPFGRFEWGPKD